MASSGDLKLTCFPANIDITFVGLQQPKQDIHQGGFPGAILTEDGVNLARFYFKIDLIIGENARESSL